MSVAIAAVFGTSASAAVVFVNASGTNTGPGTAIIGDVDAADGLWRTRAGFGNAGIYEAAGNSGAENAAQLITTLSGLTPVPSYDVWVNFLDVDNDDIQNWGIQAGFDSGSLITFADSDAASAASSPIAGATTAELASTLAYDINPTFDDGGGRFLFAGYLGSSVADGTGNLNVFVDDLNTGIGSNNRTWYDGVSYQVAAIPEPSSLTLMFGLAGAAALRRRRK